MQKDFDKWGKLKKRINVEGYIPPDAKVFDVFWASLGVNIGFEIDGQSEIYTRPVIILRKFGPKTFLVLPLTRTEKESYFCLPINFDGSSTANFSQIRTIDYRRLKSKYTVSEIVAGEKVEIELRLGDSEKEKISSKFNEIFSLKLSLHNKGEESEVENAPHIYSSIPPVLNLSNKVKVIIGVGIPGSGKTTILKNLNKDNKYVYICPDEIRKEFTGDEANQTKNAEVWEEAFRRLEKAIFKDEDVILDATNIDNLNRRKLLDFLSKFSTVDVKGVLVQVDLEIAKDRNKKRGRVVPELVLEKMYNDLQQNLPQIISDFNHMEIFNNDKEGLENIYDN